jgi:HlyD family secretion protein
MKKCMLVLIPALLAASAARGDEEPKDNPVAVLRTQAVTRGTVAVTVQATGTLEPEEVVDVGPQVTGRIDRFGADPDDRTKTVDYGSRVAEGSLLVQLDPSLYKARVERAKAHVAAAETDLKLEEVPW